MSTKSTIGSYDDGVGKVAWVLEEEMLDDTVQARVAGSGVYYAMFGGGQPCVVVELHPTLIEKIVATHAAGEFHYQRKARK